MLCLAFRAAGARFAIPARDIQVVAPLVELAHLPGAPPYIRGLMNHRGEHLPVADLTMLLCGRASRPFASTRILRVRMAGGRDMGLMAERVLKTIEIDPALLAPPGAPAAPYVLGVVPGGELVQLVDATRLLPPELLDSLSGGAA